jgi:hypothetical protein
MDRCDESASCSDYRVRGKVVGQLENVYAGLQIMKFSIATQKMWRLVAGITNPIGATMRAACRLLLFRAVIAFTARSCGSPRDTISDMQRLTRPIHFEAWTQFYNARNGFVTKDYRQSDGKLAFPEVNVGPTNASHFRADKRSVRFDGGQGVIPHD